MDEENRRRYRPGLATLLMIALLVGIALAGRHWSPLPMPRANLDMAPPPACDLQRQTCAATTGEGGRIELSIGPRPIPVLAPLQVDVSLNGIRARKVEVDFAGETMNMGYNRVTLAPAADGHHVGEASLPVCVSGPMVWIATVLVETDRQRIAVPHRFTVGP